MTAPALSDARSLRGLWMCLRDATGVFTSSALYHFGPTDLVTTRSPPFLSPPTFLVMVRVDSYKSTNKKTERREVEGSQHITTSG